MTDGHSSCVTLYPPAFEKNDTYKIINQRKCLIWAIAYFRMVSCSRAFLSFCVRTVSARAWKLQFWIHSDKVSDIHLSTNILSQKHNLYLLIAANYSAMDFKASKLINVPICFRTCSSNVISIIFEKYYIPVNANW